MIGRRARVLIASLIILVLAWPVRVHSQAPVLANPGAWHQLSPAQRAAIARNGFSVGPLDNGNYSYVQFYDLYKDALENGIPVFVTSDAVLHMFHVMYDSTLKAMERQLLAPKLRQLSQGIVQASAYQYSAATDPALKAAARLNLGYSAVALAILDPAARIPSLVAPQVHAELVLIARHQGIAPSPLFGGQIDYSQFAPRGHYNDNPTLQRYFQAMMWYSRIPFLLNGPDAIPLTRQALLLVRAVTLVPHLSTLWSQIFDPATAWVGHADDLSIRDYAAVMARVFPKNTPVNALADTAKIARFISLAQALPNPQIVGDLVGTSSGAAQATKGMRFFPQRFVPDAAIMQALTWDHVGTRQNPRIWPMGLDVAAGLGSARAAALLTGPLQQSRYAHYTQSLKKIQSYYAAQPDGTWQQNLYWRWLDVLRAVWQPAAQSSPAFMQRLPWRTRTLAAGMGSWAELRHDTLLYAKQPMGLGAGGARPPERTPYVEPVPNVWGRLLGLVQSFRQVLAQEGLLGALAAQPDQLSGSLAASLYPRPPKGETGYAAAIDSFAGLVATLHRVSQEELAGTSANAGDGHTIQYIGFEFELLDDFFQDNGAGKVLIPDQKEVPVIADVYTAPAAGQVLEEGVGDVLPLYTIVTINGHPWLTEGGVFTYYEFHQPMSNRLSDQAWRAMTHRPPLPGWTGSYLLP